jgi:hypothetical protein
MKRKKTRSTSRVVSTKTKELARDPDKTGKRNKVEAQRW